MRYEYIYSQIAIIIIELALIANLQVLALYTPTIGTS
jgi:hypothetical protein